MPQIIEAVIKAKKVPTQQGVTTEVASDMMVNKSENKYKMFFGLFVF